MVKLVITPTQGKFTARHPVTGDTEFEKADGTTVQGIFYVVGSSSKEFYNYINGKRAYDILQESDGDDTGEMLAALIVGWDDTGFVDVPYSKEEALDMMNSPENLWLRQQLKDFMEDQSNFFAKEVKA